MTESELTILSLVAEKPCHGYEIQQIIDERGLREWLAIGFSSIYYILNKLEQQGLLTSELDINGPGPARKIYQITDAGRGLLQTAIQERLSQLRSFGSGFELGLANLNAMSPRQVYQALVQHRASLVQRLESLQKAWARHQQDDNPLQDHTRALYTYSLSIAQAELTWLMDFLESWVARYPQAANQPPGSDAVNPAQVIQRLKRPPRTTEE
ncbi:MAG: PadR family transcriptional regulator [Anaerolineae bacterium]|nr:PadR family transcriptional regulator [Anaerolineae bacterium]